MTKNTTGLGLYQKTMKKDGYSQAPAAGSPTYTEAWALIEAARRMATAIETYSKMDDPKAPKSREILREPLRLNWRLWTIFQAELINSLDEEKDQAFVDIRTNMLTLCQFVDKHTTEALADPQPERLATLIDINRNIASGLLETPANPLADKEVAVESNANPTQSMSNKDYDRQTPITGKISEDV